MQNLFIPASANTPEVDFRFDEHRLALRGESFPENAAAFYGPLLERLRDYLADSTSHAISVNAELIYFNSSSTKMLFNVFGLLNECARGGRHVTLNWYHEEDDETMFEFGQELQEDFEALVFRDQPMRAAS